MKIKYILLTAGAVFLTACSSQNMQHTNKSTFKYPIAEKGKQKDTYFGTKVTDPYRDLENDSEATKKWVDEEVALSQDYLSKIPYRDSIKNHLRDIWNYEKISAPFIEAN